MKVINLAVLAGQSEKAAAYLQDAAQETTWNGRVAAGEKRGETKQGVTPDGLWTTNLRPGAKKALEATPGEVTMKPVKLADFSASAEVVASSLKNGAVQWTDVLTADEKRGMGKQGITSEGLRTSSLPANKPSK